MGFYKQRQPRQFHRSYIYYDERKEKLQNIEDNAKRRLGLMPEKETTHEEAIRGKFAEQTTHLKRRIDDDKEGRRHLSPFAAFLIVVSLIAIWRLLLR